MIPKFKIQEAVLFTSLLLTCVLTACGKPLAPQPEIGQEPAGIQNSATVAALNDDFAFSILDSGQYGSQWPDPAKPVASDGVFSSVGAEGAEVIFEKVIPLLASSGDEKKPLSPRFLAWRSLKNATQPQFTYEYRYVTPDNRTLAGDQPRTLVSYDERSQLWYIPLHEVMGAHPEVSSPEIEQRFVLASSMRNGQLPTLTVRFRVGTRIQKLAETPARSSVSSLADFSGESRKLTFEIRSLNFRNTSSRAVRAWFPLHGVEGVGRQLVSHSFYENGRKPGPSSTEFLGSSFGVTSSELRLTVLANGQLPQLITTETAAELTAVLLLPGDSVEASWFGQPAARFCSVPATRSQTVSWTETRTSPHRGEDHEVVRSAQMPESWTLHGASMMMTRGPDIFVTSSTLTTTELSRFFKARSSGDMQRYELAVRTQALSSDPQPRLLGDSRVSQTHPPHPCN